MVIAGKGCPTQAPAERIAATDGAQLPAPRAGARARDRLPLGRPERGAGDREPERDQPRRWRRGRSRSPTGARCRRPRSRRGAATRPTSRPPRRAFLHRARMNSLAVAGEWSAELRAGGARLALDGARAAPRRARRARSCLLVARPRGSTAGDEPACHDLRRLGRDGDRLRPRREADRRAGASTCGSRSPPAGGSATSAAPTTASGRPT